MSAFTLEGTASKKRSSARDDSKGASLQPAGTQRRAAAKERRQDPFAQNPGVRSELQLESDLNGSQRVAAQRKLASVLSRRKTDSLPNTLMQRVGNDEEEQLLSASGESAAAQREAIAGTGVLDEDEEPLQGRFETAQKCNDENMRPGETEGAAIQRAPNKTGLPDNLKTGIESLSGLSMDDVSVRYNSEKPAQLQALAYTQGNDIYVAPNQEQHLPHEAWHAVQQKQGRVQPTAQAKGIPVNDESALETEADEMGAKALQMKEAPSTREAGPSRGVIQRRTSVAGRTIVTGENVGEIIAYINSKQKYDQEQENNRASRRKETPREIPKLDTVKLSDVIGFFKVLYPYYSPAVPFAAIIDLLRDWANAKGPSEVMTEGSGKSESVPLVLTQDNSFATFSELFLALVDNVRAERSRQQHEKVAFEVLANLESYLPVLEEMLGNIALRSRDVPEDVVERMVKEGYARFLIRELPPEKRDLVQLIIRNESDALRKLYLAMNTIHSFAVTMKKLAPQRSDISREMGDRRDKYSPYGPEVEGAREKGLAVWSSFSGSAADILNLAQNFGVSQDGINRLAALTSAFFYFLPTSKNPTHTLHEVMAVAARYFNVPYDPMNPTGTLPHALRLSSSTSEATERRTIPRVGPKQEGVEEVDIARLNMLHDVPRKGVSEDNISNIRKMISAEGYNLKYPVSATRLPNGFYLVTGGHHRIAAMKQLGERTVPVKIYSAAETPPILMARMIGIARITGKYHSQWLPPLTDLQKVEVNMYLKQWMKQNDNQVLYPFQYTLRGTPTGGLYPNEVDPMEGRKSKL